MRHKQLVEVLKKTLKSKGITYLELSKMLKISEPSVKRLFSLGTFSLDRFMEVCHLIGISLNDLSKMVEINTEEKVHIFTLEQEKFFAKNVNFFSFFDMLFKSTPKQIAKKFDLDDNEVSKYLCQLDKLGLIEWLPGNKVKFLTPSRFRFRENGVLYKSIRKIAYADFSKSKFDGPLDITDFRHFELSKSSQKKLFYNLEELLKEYTKISELEKIMKMSTERVGINIAMRSWKDSYLEKL